MTDMVDAMRDTAAIVHARQRRDVDGIDTVLAYGDTRAIVFSLADLSITLAAVAEVPIDELLDIMRRRGAQPDN